MAYNPQNPNGQATKANSSPVVIASDDDLQGKLGALTETAPSTDTASSGINGRLQRIAQRLTTISANTEVISNSGSFTATSQSVQTSINGHSSASVRVSGTWSGTISCAVSFDATAWETLEYRDFSDGSISTTTTTNRHMQYVLPPNYTYFRVFAASISSGTATIAVALTKNQTGTFIFNGSGSKAVPIQDGGNSITVDNGGTFQIQESGAALTSLQLLDDVIITDNAGFTDGTTKVEMQGFIFDETAGTALTENDAAAARIDSKRAQVLVIEDATTRGQRQSISAAGAAHVNIAQVAANTLSTGNGTTGTGSPRVTIASDNTAFGVIPKASTSGGLTTFHLSSAATTNATVVKSSAGQLYGWYIYNNATSMRKVAFHNASTTPTAGVSIYYALCIPASSGANVFNDLGIPFSTGIAITTVTGAADSNATAVAADDLNINLWYF